MNDHFATWESATVCCECGAWLERDTWNGPPDDHFIEDENGNPGVLCQMCTDANYEEDM